MADIIDVLSTVVSQISDVIYPNGGAQPSITTRPVKIVYGWPLKEDLDAVLLAGNTYVSVFADQGERLTSKFSPQWIKMGQLPITTTTSISQSESGWVLTIGGTITADEVIFVKDESYYIGIQFQSGWTVENVVSAILAGIPDASAGASANEVVFPSELSAWMVPVWTYRKEIKRQRVSVRVISWAADPADRDLLSSSIDQVLGNLSRFTLPDGFDANIFYAGNYLIDKFQNQSLYRRDLVYSVDYPTTIEQNISDIAIVDVHESAQSNAAVTNQVTITVAGNTLVLPRNGWGNPFELLTLGGVDGSYGATITVDLQNTLVIPANGVFSANQGKLSSSTLRNDYSLADLQAALRALRAGFFPKRGVCQVTLSIQGTTAFSAPLVQTATFMLIGDPFSVVGTAQSLTVPAATSLFPLVSAGTFSNFSYTESDGGKSVYLRLTFIPDALTWLPAFTITNYEAVGLTYQNQGVWKSSAMLVSAFGAWFDNFIVTANIQRNDSPYNPVVGATWTNFLSFDLVDSEGTVYPLMSREDESEMWTNTTLTPSGISANPTIVSGQRWVPSWPFFEDPVVETPAASTNYVFSTEDSKSFTAMYGAAPTITSILFYIGSVYVELYVAPDKSLSYCSLVPADDEDTFQYLGKGIWRSEPMDASYVQTYLDTVVNPSSWYSCASQADSSFIEGRVLLLINAGGVRMPVTVYPAKNTNALTGQSKITNTTPHPFCKPWNI